MGTWVSPVFITLEEVSKLGGVSEGAQRKGVLGFFFLFNFLPGNCLGKDSWRSQLGWESHA